ncbi:MAG TPA: hypothetical protein VMT30_00240 [Candidatus Saccharimonadia bacterium]|nr:hypothetical protein [Candidatus Saccharimonadia bacterium]
MLVIPRYSHYSHTGWLAHHRDTSYALLLFLTIGVGLLLAGFTWSVRADSCDPSPSTTCSASYGVTAVVPGPRPAKPAVITSPSSGQTFGTNPVTVEGTCPDKALIKVFTNGILVGSVICDASGHFKVPVDLVVGRNDLTALPYNTLDQEGPTSPTVTVTLNQPPGGYGFSTELILQSVNFYRGSEPGAEITWPVEIVGGQAPYAVSVDWGDGTSDLITRLAPGPFTVKHTYRKVGTGYLGSFPLIIRATDAVGHTAYLQLTTIVNAATAGAGNKAATVPVATNLLIIWPLWIVLLLMIVSFWLGERREKRIMEKRLAALA